MKKYTLITGASSGIGNSLAKKFASKGHNLIIVARRENLLKKLSDEIINKYKIDVKLYVYDLSLMENIDKFWNDVDQFEIELLVNNAGFGDFNWIFDTELDKFNKMIDLNVKSLGNLTIKYLKKYKNKEGQIINVSSVLGYSNLSFAIPYSATKFYVSAFSEGIDQYLNKINSKIRVKVLAPAGTITEFQKIAGENTKSDKLKDDLKSRGNSSSYISSDKLAEFGYELYKSKKTVGIVNSKNEFELKDPIFPSRG